MIDGSRVQFRPVLMLIVVAALGHGARHALARGIGSDIQRPLATVVVGGLASTLILTLLALPAVFWLGERLGLRRSGTTAGRSSSIP